MHCGVICRTLNSQSRDIKIHVVFQARSRFIAGLKVTGHHQERRLPLSTFLRLVSRMHPEENPNQFYSKLRYTKLGKIVEILELMCV